MLWLVIVLMSIITLFFHLMNKIVNGTTGTPLGGFGCGAIKFDANTEHSQR
jgi:hypothetical protein